MSYSEWKDVFLEDAIEFRNGKSSPERKDQSSNPVYGGNGVIGYTEEFNSSSETIIVGRVGAYCGSVYFYQGKCWVTDNAIIGKVKENYDGRFLFYLLKLLDLNSHRTGSSQPLVNQSILNSIQVRVPKQKQVQKRIADLLSALDDKIELNRQTNQTLESIAQAIYKEWFVNFNFPGATGEMQDSELGPIPKGWGLQTLGDVSEVITKGTTPTTLGDKFVKNGIKFLRAENIQDHLEIDTSKTLSITIETQEKLKRSQLIENDILITIAGTIGRMGIATNRILPANVNQAIGVIRVRHGILPVLFVFYYLKQKKVKDTLLSGITQSVQANISLSDLRRLKITIPPPKILTQFYAVALSLKKTIETLTEQSSCLTLIRDFLLPKLMSGEIEV